MTDHIKARIENHLKNRVPKDNLDWIGDPDADDIIVNPHFRYVTPTGEKEIDDDATENEIVQATQNALANLLAVRIYEYAIERYAKIDAGEFFDSTGWATVSGDLAQSMLPDDWQMETKKAIKDDIETKFGKNCIKVCTFDELCNWYDETNAQPFEEWLVEKTGFDRTGIPDDLEALFEELDKTYMDTRFAVCVPENIRQNWRHDPPLHECTLREIDW